MAKRKKGVYQKAIVELAKLEGGKSEISMGNWRSAGKYFSIKLASDPAFLVAVLALGVRHLKAKR